MASRGPPCYGIATKPVTTRATTATHARCVQRRLGRENPGARLGSRNAVEDDPRPSILQLNTEGLIANKITVIEQPAYKNKAFLIVLQETHCTATDKLVILDFSLAASVQKAHLTARQTCSRKVPAITTLALTHNVTKTQTFVPTAIR